MDDDTFKEAGKVGVWTKRTASRCSMIFRIPTLGRQSLESMNRHDLVLAVKALRRNMMRESHDARYRHRRQRRHLCRGDWGARRPRWNGRSQHHACPCGATRELDFGRQSARGRDVLRRLAEAIVLSLIRA
jgi:hypothetical protein